MNQLLLVNTFFLSSVSFVKDISREWRGASMEKMEDRRKAIRNIDEPTAMNGAVNINVKGSEGFYRIKKSLTIPPDVKDH